MEHGRHLRQQRVRGGASTANGVVYVGIGGCSNGSAGVVAFSTSGAAKWHAGSPDGGGVYDPPTIANGVLYFGSSNGNVYAYTSQA